ncbi:hypothetical protein KC353_g13948, partial [Hortaea werneckii]
MSVKRSRTLDAFFSPPASKKARTEDNQTASTSTVGTDDTSPSKLSKHPTYPFALPHLPVEISDLLNFVPASEGRVIKDQSNLPDLDVVCYEPYVPKDIQRDFFEFLRRELFFYRVKYTIKRGPTETQINTPRYTTVFGVDATSRFSEDGEVVDTATGRPAPSGTYKC